MKLMLSKNFTFAKDVILLTCFSTGPLAVRIGLAQRVHVHEAVRENSYIVLTLKPRSY